MSVYKDKYYYNKNDGWYDKHLILLNIMYENVHNISKKIPY